MKFKKYIEENTLRQEVSHRGGGIEVDVTELLQIENPETRYKMTAYQNYLGGGMTASIQSDQNFELKELTDGQQVMVEKFTKELKQYFYSLNGGGWGNGEETYEDVQSRPASYPGL